MLVSVVETSGMELGSGMFTDEGVDGEMLRCGEGVISGTAGECDCLFGYVSEASGGAVVGMCVENRWISISGTVNAVRLWAR